MRANCLDESITDAGSDVRTASGRKYARLPALACDKSRGTELRVAALAIPHREGYGVGARLLLHDQLGTIFSRFCGTHQLFALRITIDVILENACGTRAAGAKSGSAS